MDFRGTNAQTSYGAFPPVMTPATWATGTSLSHWQGPTTAAPSLPVTQQGGVNAIMNPSVAPGVQNRTLRAFEMQTLRDLGYTLDPTLVSDWSTY